MYYLKIFYPDEPAPRQSKSFSSAKKALAEISGLLEANEGCARLDMLADDTRLFSVDRVGNRLPEP